MDRQLADDPNVDDRSGPYLLFDDEQADVLPPLADEDAGANPLRRDAPRGRRAGSLRRLLTAIARAGSRGIESAPAWRDALRPAGLCATAAGIAIGVVLAAGAGPFGTAEAGVAMLATFAALAAHAGHDLLRADLAARARAAEAADRPRLRVAAAVAHATAVAAVLALAGIAGPGIAWFAGAGLALSIASVLAPVSLRERGLPEAVAALAAGPIAVVGAFYALRGDAPPAAWACSGAYAIAIAVGALGSAIDERARGATVALAQAFFLVVAALVVCGLAPTPALAVLLALPRFRRLAVAGAAGGPNAPLATSAAAAPYGVCATRFARSAGVLLLVGLVAGVVAGA
ncbi:MAG TPA: hypothetical protein VFD92_27025 [Candidatus Binatia bacterium]|nr:hypothetical protein [Candidatus Binatia bacterium]